MTTAQILSIARKKLLETTEDIVSDDTLLLYGNLAQQDIIKRVFPNDQIGSATITFINGSGTLPTDFGTLYGSGIDANNQSYGEMSIEDFANMQNGYGLTVENNVMKVYPTTTGSVTVKYYKVFPDITASVNPTLNTYFHEIIIYGILQRAFEDLQDEELSVFYANKYENMIKQRIANQSNYEEGNQRSGQMFTTPTLISDGWFGLGSSPDHF